MTNCLFQNFPETQPIQERGEACIKAYVVCRIGEMLPITVVVASLDAFDVAIMIIRSVIIRLLQLIIDNIPNLAFIVALRPHSISGLDCSSREAKIRGRIS